MARDIKIQFLGDSSDLDRASKDATSSLDRFSRRAGVISGVVSSVTTAAFRAASTGVHALVGFTKGAIAEAEEAQRIGKVTATIIKSTGGAANVTSKHVSALTESLSNLTGIDDEVIQAGTNVMLTFKRVRNEVGKGNNVFDRSQKAALDLSAVLGTDLKAANIQLGKALNDPVKGITALRRAGISFTESQQEAIKTAVAHNDVLTAQKIILGEVESEVGGAAEANATATQKMSTAWANFKEDIGTLILPAFQRFVDWFTQTALPAIEGFTTRSVDVLKRWARGIADAFGAGFGGKDFESKAKGIQRVIEDIANAGGKAFRDAVDALKDLGKWAHDHATDLQIAGAALAGFAVGMKAVSTASKGVSAVQGFSSALGPLVGALVSAGPPGWIAGAVLAVAAAAVVAYLKIKPFHDLVNNIGEKFLRNAPQIVRFYQIVIPQAVDQARASVQLLNESIVSPALQSAFNFALGLWQQYGDQITGIVSNVVIIVGALFRAMASGVQSAFNILGSIASGALAQVQGAFAIFVAVVGPMWSGFLNGLQSGWNRFGSQILGAASAVFTSLRGVIEGALKIIQGVFAEVAGFITGDWSRFWGGIERITQGGLQIVGNIVRGSFNVLVGAFRTLDVVINGIWSGLWNGLAAIVRDAFGPISRAWDAIVRGVKDAFNSVVEFVDKIKSKLKEIPGAGILSHIPGVSSITGNAVGGNAFVAARTAPSLSAQRALTTRATAPAAVATLAMRPVIVNLPEGIDGQNVVNAIVRYTRRNGATAWRR